MTPVVSSAARSRYAARVADITRQYAALPAGAPVRLAKPTSNLFRTRSASTAPGLDVSGLDTVLSVDPDAGTADVGGMTTYEDLVAATLAYGLAPLCVPQLRTITLGGAVTGLGIESSSFRNGCPHESVLNMDILTGAGEVLTVSDAEDDPHLALFRGFPNSYGSLGYALRLRIELEPVKPYVHLRHIPFRTADALAEAIAQITRSRTYQGRRVDYADGTVFSPSEHYLSLGELVEQAPEPPSDYTGMLVYYRSIQHRRTDVLSIHDYLWRWDTDWFWCSRAFGAQRPAIRRLWPKPKLRSDVYWKLVALDRRWSASDRWDRWRGKPWRENVVQDVEIPVDRLAEFLEFFHAEVGIEPMWVCPLRQRDSRRWPSYELDPQTTYVNVGFWSSVPLPAELDPADGPTNRRIEAVVSELGGRKSLYSDAHYSREDFDQIYGGTDYQLLRKHYDPQSRLLDMYAKCVERR